MKKLLVLCSIVLFVLSSIVTPNPCAATNSESQPTLISPVEQSPLVPWNLFWKLFRKHCAWTLQYRVDAAWVNRTDLLTIQRFQPYENTTKINLIFDSLSFVADYRLTLGINRKVKHYMNRTGHVIELSYRDYTVVFDWSDLANITGLTFKRGFKNDMFWFRIRKDNVPADKTYELDPTVIVDQSSSKGVDYPHQLKTFRNPRGLEWNYAMVYNQSGSDYRLLMYKSEDGDTWVFEEYIHNFTGDDYGSSSLWISENASQSCLDVYFGYTELDTGTESLYYVRGTIADAGSTLSLGSEQTIDTGEYRFPTITLAENGYIWITVEKRHGGSSTHALNAFSADTQDWNTVGGSPWLDTANDGDYIWESAKNNEMEYFSFVGGCSGTIVNVDAVFFCRQEAGGNDYFEVEFWKGAGWQYSGDVTPTAHATRYFYISLNVTDELDTDTRVNNASMRLDKKSVGGGDDVFIDQAFLSVEVATKRTVEAWVSNLTYTPTSSDWEQFNVVDDGEDGYKLPIVLPLSSVSDTVVLWRVEDIGDSKEYIRAKDCNWSGSGSVDFGQENETACEVSGGHLVESFFFFRAVADENNLIHTVAQWYASGPDYYRYFNYTVGEGFGAFQSVTTDTSYEALSLSIDLSCTPNKLYVHFVKHSATKYLGYKMDYVDDIDWSDNTFWTADQDIIIAGLTASYQTGPENVAQMIYINDVTNNSIYFEEFRSCFVTYRFFDGGPLYVNGTSTANGTVMEYKHHLNEFITNITFIVPYSYAFENYTYDSSTSTDNPFYLDVIQDYTVYAYIEKVASWYLAAVSAAALTGVPLLAIILIRRRKL